MRIIRLRCVDGMNFEFSRGKDCRGRPVDFRTSVYKNRLRVLQKLANVQITAIRGGAVPKRSEGMKRKRNPEKLLINSAVEQNIHFEDC